MKAMKRREAAGCLSSQPFARRSTTKSNLADVESIAITPSMARFYRLDEYDQGPLRTTANVGSRS